MAVDEANTVKNTPEGGKPEVQGASVDAIKKDAKDINKTRGGRIVNFFNNWIVGCIGNSILSVYITYTLNTKQSAKEGRARFSKGVAKFLGGDPTQAGLSDEKREKRVKFHDTVAEQVRSGVEIFFMFLAGIIATTAMTPLVMNREKIAYKINKMIGKDTDVLPSHMIHAASPENEQERIEQAISKRVTSKQTAGDLWKARAASMGIIVVLDQGINRGNRVLEKNNIFSLDDAFLAAGQRMYGVMGESAAKRYVNWFERHKSGAEDIKEKNRGQYDRLEAKELKYNGNTDLNTDRMVISEQARLLGKEWSLTFIMAGLVEKITNSFHKNRVARQRRNAIAALKAEGVIPKDWKDGKPYDFAKLENKEQQVESEVKPTTAQGVQLSDKEQEKTKEIIAEMKESPKREEEAALTEHVENTREVKHSDRTQSKDISSITPRKDAPVEVMSLHGGY